MKIESRFQKGDKVFLATTTYKEKSVECPDCLGSLVWTVKFATGSEEQVACQTCKRGWEHSAGRVSYKEWSPLVERVTVGSVRYDGNDKKPFSYMCIETGVGSGRVYHDDELFLNEEEAQKRAEEKHQEQMKDIAQNNFQKKFGGTKDLENALSTFGFTRGKVVRETKKFRQWAKLADLAPSSKTY